MNPRTRRAALRAIGAIALLASLDALAHSYTGLYGWAVHHRFDGWQAMSWPAEIDVFLVVGELALYVAYLDGWPARQRIWPWLTAVTGLIVSVAGNVGHVQPLPGAPVTLADRLTAATSPVAAFAGLMIGLLVLKMSSQHLAPGERVADAQDDEQVVTLSLAAVVDPCAPEGDELTLGALYLDPRLLQDAAEITEAAHVNGLSVSQRALAAQLRERGHRFSNAQLRSIVRAASPTVGQQAA